MFGFRFWQAWLFYVSVGVVVFGVLLAFLTPKRLLPPYHAAVNRALWGRSDLPPDVVDFHGFIFAVLGATMASQAALQAFLARYPFSRRERWAWWAVLAGMLIWFPLDTARSLYWGVWPNAVFNLFAFLAVVVPLAATRRDFYAGPSQPHAPQQ